MPLPPPSSGASTHLGAISGCNASHATRDDYTLWAESISIQKSSWPCQRTPPPWLPSTISMAYLAAESPVTSWDLKRVFFWIVDTEKASNRDHSCMESNLPGHEIQRVEMVDYISEMEYHRDRRRGSKNVNGAEEAKDIMEEEKKIRVTKKVGEEINQWLSAFLGCWESPWHQSFAKQSNLALISFSPSLIEENVWLNMFPYLSPLQESPCRPIKKSNISVCPSSEVGSIIPVIFSGGPQYEFLRYLSTQQSKQSLSLPYFPCSSLTLL